MIPITSRANINPLNPQLQILIQQQCEQAEGGPQSTTKRPFEAIIEMMENESLRYRDYNHTFQLEWDRFKKASIDTLKPEQIARTLYMRILGEGSCAWSKILASAFELGDSEKAKIWIQAVYLILNDQRLPPATKEEKSAFNDLFEKYKPEPLERMIANWKEKTRDPNIELQFFQFTNFISKESAEELFRSIDIQKCVAKDKRLIMLLLVIMDPEFWEDKESALSCLTEQSRKQVDSSNENPIAINRLDKVLLNEFLLKCVLLNVGDMEAVWLSLATDEIFVISGFIHRIYANRHALGPEVLISMIELAQNPIDLRVIARIIDANVYRWDNEGFQQVMRSALMKDHLVFQLSPKIIEKYFGEDILKCFRDLDIPEIEKLVESCVNEFARLDKASAVPVLLKGALIARYLEVYADCNSKIKEMYHRFFDLTNTDKICILCWNLDYGSDLEGPISDSWQRRFNKKNGDSENSEFLLKAISIRNNYLGANLFNIALGVVAVLREAEAGLEWHKKNVDLIKTMFGKPEFFTFLANANLYKQALKIYLATQPIPGWLVKFATTMINTKNVAFSPESWDLLEDQLVQESWTIADVNHAYRVNEYLIRLLELTEIKLDALEGSTAEDLLDWIDSILKCKEGTEEDWNAIQEVLKRIHSKMKKPPKRAAQKGKGKSLKKTNDPFAIKWTVLADHIKKTVNSEESVLELIKQRRAEAFNFFTAKRNESQDPFAETYDKYLTELKNTEIEPSEDPILENLNVAKKLALKTITDLCEETKQSIISLYERKEKEVETYLLAQSKEKKYAIISKRLKQWHKGVVDGVEQTYLSIIETNRTKIQVQEEIIANTAKQRDFYLRKKEFLQRPKPVLGADPYVDIIKKEDQALEELDQKRLEKIDRAETDEEIERIEKVFNQKVQDIRARFHHKVGRVAKVKIADNSEEMLRKRIKALESENLKIRKALERSEAAVNLLQEKSTSSKAVVEDVPTISSDDLIALLEALSTKAANAKKMIKMIQRQGSVLTKVDDLIQFLELAGFQRAQDHGGSHRNFKGPNNSSITISNHETDSTQDEINNVIETVYKAFS